MNEAREPLIEELLFRCLEAADFGAAIAAAATDHPELAGQLERLAAQLREQGLVGDEPQNNALALAPFGEQRTLGPFEIRERLGEGGMGVVYRAWQSSPDREVALKVIRPELLHFEGSRARFQREVDAVAKLSHPGIVPIHEVGATDGVPWFSMAFVRGQSLAAILQGFADRDPATLRGDDLEHALAAGGDPESHGSTTATSRASAWTGIVAQIVRGIAMALQHAHSRGVLHRDVKPSNVMLASDGRPMLLDFGLALTDDSQRLTRSHAQIGSLPYMAPELLLGAATEPTAALDVYALGVTLYEALALRNPFLAPTAERTRRNVLAASPPPLRRYNSKVSRDLATICATAMAEYPQRRYATVASLARDLESWGAGAAIAASPDTVFERVVRFARRNRVVVAATALIVVSLAIGAGISTAMYLESEQQRAIADRSAYIANVARAEDALRRDQPHLAVEALLAAPPSERRWEWRHLLHRLDSSRAVLLRGDRMLRGVAVDAQRAAVVADGALRLVDLETGTLERELAPSGVRAVAVANGHVAWVERRGIRLLNPAGVLGFFGEGDWSAIAIDPAGTHVAATAGGDPRLPVQESAGRIAVWHSDGRLLWQKTNHGGLHCVAFSPDGALVACGGGAMQVVVLDAADGRQKCLLRGHRSAIDAVAFGAGGRLASASRDRTAMLWSIPSGERIGFPLMHDGAVRSLAFRLRGRELVTASEAGLTRWSARTGHRLGSLHGHRADITSIAAWGQDLVTVSLDGTLRHWSVAAEDVPRIRSHVDAVVDVAVSPDGRLVASVARDGRAQVCDIAARDPVYDGSMTPLGLGVATCFAPSGERVAFVGRTRFMVCATSDWSVRFVRDAKAGEFAAAAFSPNGRTLATTGRGGMALTLWDADTGGALQSFPCPESGGSAVVFTTDTQLAVCGETDQGVRLWNRLDVGVSSILSQQDHDVLALDPSGMRLAAAGEHGVSIWDLDTLTPRAPLPCGRVTDVVYGPDGDRMLLAGEDGVIRLWTENREVARLHSAVAVLALGFDRAGNTLVSGDASGELRVWSAVPRLQIAARLAELEHESRSIPTRSILGAAIVAGQRVEAEDLVVAVRSGGQVATQSADALSLGGRGRRWWSRGRAGDRIEFAVPMARPGRYRLRARLTRSWDYGTVQMLWNDVALGGAMDCRRLQPDEIEIELGVVDARAGQNTWTVRVAVDSEPLAPSQSVNGFGVDWIELLPITASR